MTAPTLPRIALTLGDPAGIGPELIARLVARADLMAQARVVVVGDRWLWTEAQRIAQVELKLPEVASFAALRDADGTPPVFLPLDTVAQAAVVPATANAAGGASVLAVLRASLRAATAGQVDAICFAPLNKLAMKQAGLGFEDELHFFAHELGVKTFIGEFNVLDRMWTSRVSSHIPLREAAANLDGGRIKEAARILHRALLQAGYARPRLAVAALNPHAGEGGTCGREEIDIIAPAIRELAAEGLDAAGPFPADTIFLKVRAGEHDGVVTLYHDQGQIALKLMGFSRGVTVQGGLPVVITTPAHGTAYDIAGRGRADPGATIQAFNVAVAMGSRRRP